MASYESVVTLSIYDNGLFAVKFLQRRFSDPTSERILLWFSHLGSPTNGFFLFFPFAFGLSSFVGHQMLWVAVFSEWLNVIFKWGFNDDRPYWWINSQKHIRNKELKQWKETCESGPGFPSGHVMCTSAALILLALTVKEYYSARSKSKIRSFLVTSTLWTALSLLLFFIGVSRIYIATHFPHQVTTGFITGTLVALGIRVLGRTAPRLLYSPTNIMLSFLLLGTGFAVYNWMLYIGSDPMGSVNKALASCKRKEWVHLDTTIFYSIIRDAGALCGLGLVSMYSRAYETENYSNRTKVIIAIVETFLLMLYERVPLPDHNVTLFYILAYFKYLLVPILVCVLIPYVLYLFVLSPRSKLKTS